MYAQGAAEGYVLWESESTRSSLTSPTHRRRAVTWWQEQLLLCHVPLMRCPCTGGFFLYFYICFSHMFSPLKEQVKGKVFSLFHIPNELRIEVAEIKVGRNMENRFLKKTNRKIKQM